MEKQRILVMGGAGFIGTNLVAELAENEYETAVHVVDGRSVDHTRDIADEKGAQVITERRSGEGAALQTAFRAVDDSRAHRLRTARKISRSLSSVDSASNKRLIYGSSVRTTYPPMILDGKTPATLRQSA
jgi:nucleoside-diphosphate-sugar epimerase